VKYYKKYIEEFKKINQNLEIFEKALSTEDRDKIDRLILSNQCEFVLKEFNRLIEELKIEIESMDFDEILINQLDSNNLEIRYSPKIRGILLYLDNKRVELKNSGDKEKEKIVEFLYKDGSEDIYLDISIQPPLNRIDVNNELPVFMRGLGLGKKIYKKLIKNLGFISSFKGYEPSIWSDLVWNKLSMDPDLYFFSNSDNFICFWNEIEFEEIIFKLKEFFKEKGERIFDNDFKIKFQLDDSKINEILDD